MTPEERGQSKTLVYQYLPSRYGMNPDDLRKADAIEVVVGQGAKPGGGGMLLGPEDLRPRRRDAHAPEGHRPALRLSPSRLDRPRRSRDQDPRAARDHRLGEADLHQGRRRAALLRRRARGQSRRRRGRGRRHAGRHGRDAGGLHRARRSADAGLHPPGRAGAAGLGHAPQGPAHHLRRHPQRRRRGQGARRSVPTRSPSAPPRSSRSATTIRRSSPSTKSSTRLPAPTTTGTRAAIRPASPPRIPSSRSVSIRCAPAAASRTT